MKTVTELSGTLLRMAEKAVAEARRSLPKEEKSVEVPAAEPQPPPEAVASEPGGAPAAEGAEAPVAEGGVAEAAVAEGAAATDAGSTAEASPAPAAAARAPKTEPEEAPESEAVKAALDAAVAAATGLSGNRLSMARDALKAAGRRISDVRLVRVFAPDEAVPGAKLIGEYQYLVDLSPTTMRQDTGGQKKDRGGRGGGRGGGGGGGGRGGGSGKGAPASGGFSMDSLREDRKNERGSRPGFGRPGGGRPGGGARPGGGRPGGAPGGGGGGGPKK